MHGVTIELFCCSGGMAEGFRRAGITFDWSFDQDPNAVASYTHNLGRAPVQMDVRDLLRMARGGWSPGPVRLLVADPPCVPWSRAGKRLGTADERDMLVETADLIAVLRPRAYLIGNVPGLTDSGQWHVVQDVIGGLAKYGYCVRDYGEFDAADYGVPQHRVRPFWYGHLSGPCIRWPEPTHTDPAHLATLRLPGTGSPLKRWVTCRDALSHLPLEELGRPVRMRCADGQQRKSRAQGMRVGDADRVGATLTAKASRVGAGEAHVLGWPWGPATTIVCDKRIGSPGHHGGTAWTSAPNAIVLSERAATWPFAAAAWLGSAAGGSVAAAGAMLHSALADSTRVSRISCAIEGFSARYAIVLSRPCPSFSPLKLARYGTVISPSYTSRRR